MHLFIHSIALLNDNRVRLSIIGEGADTEYLKNLARKLGVENNVIFKGQIPHKEIKNELMNSHLFAHPSLLEGTPHSVNEALSVGLPVICHDIRGHGYAVTEDCGFKIPMISPKKSIAGFAEISIKVNQNTY